MLANALAFDPETQLRPRPQKVTFSSISDRDAVLNAAPGLNGHSNYGAVRISKFLLPDEIARMKQLRIQCMERNDAAAASGDTSKPYVVIDTKLMM